MPKKIMVADHDMQWLRDNHKNYRYPELADKIGVCTDTLKRILVREGLQDFAGAKYQVSRASKANQKWARPCMRCKWGGAPPPRERHKGKRDKGKGKRQRGGRPEEGVKKYFVLDF